MTHSSEAWSGHASSYDLARPKPPEALPEILTQLLGISRPRLVVDLGSGTGLSTMIWHSRSDQVIGIEPNADMREQATSKLVSAADESDVSFLGGLAQQTGLSDACADIVTCAQAFHWMEPTATLAEVARILQPGGLFAAYDYDTPPAVQWKLDQCALEMSRRLVMLVRKRGLPAGFRIWPKDQHLANMRDSGLFRFTRELLLHQVEYGNAERYLAMMRSNAFSGLFQFTDEELGLDELGRVAEAVVGVNQASFYFSYRVRIGVK